jgi:large conductance mechanosensitive channel
MKKMLDEFKPFAFKGNLLDLAVAVVLAGAFALVVGSFTNDILMSIIAAVFGEADFSAVTIELGDGVIKIGSFINTLINFTIIALALFLVVKAANAVIKKNEEEAGPTEIELLTEIRDSLRTRS